MVPLLTSSLPPKLPLAIRPAAQYKNGNGNDNSPSHAKPNSHHQLGPGADGVHMECDLAVEARGRAGGVVQRVAENYGMYTVQWIDEERREAQPPRTVLFFKKPNERKTMHALRDISKFLLRQYPTTNIVLEPLVHDELERVDSELAARCFTVESAGGANQNGTKAQEQEQEHPDPPCLEYTRVADLVIALGGDGTLLHLAKMFPYEVPPVLCFSMGTLGFLMPFDVAEHAAVISGIMEPPFTTTTFTPRMRIQVQMRDKDGERAKLFGRETGVEDDGVEHHYVAQFMNELLLHRGGSPSMVTLSCQVDGEFFTRTTGDGVIFATPTGSTAYALASGGPLVHPLIPSIQLCPVCPQSLSFRSILLPPDSFVRIQVDKPGHGKKGTTGVEVSGDGRVVGHVGEGGAVELQTSPFPVPTINRPAHRVTWVRDTNELLRWNIGFHTPGARDEDGSASESDESEREELADADIERKMGRMLTSRRMSSGFGCDSSKPARRGSKGGDLEDHAGGEPRG
ncbi:ATP-NAD kinase [Gonapodya prolifera JEL478]|uniref:ATP-NAD kinase n=1 Tax=Gonapodya prolifera (strain JEL478) TaxID=1344416 RepID=A0A139A8V9_GONPJ|nr:ATP-NAD kinase [Gonapodya prolifera JEL478]|eukprot:KXS13261.1 ATP-NAD kinase [Gonapodya prolifera JEL478]